MKILDKALFVIILFGIYSIDAKYITSPQSSRNIGSAQPAPINTGIVPPQRRNAPEKMQRSSSSNKTYKDLHDEIMTMPSRMVINEDKEGNVILSPAFIEKVKSDMRNNDIDYDFLKFLLQTARDKHIPLGEDDLTIITNLQKINEQIDKAMGS
jgi:hypothetical protein